VRTVAPVIVIGKEEGVRTVSGPHVVELCRVPKRLVRYLRHAYYIITLAYIPSLS
jgi:hypothetical protein